MHETPHIFPDRRSHNAPDPFRRPEKRHAEKIQPRKDEHELERCLALTSKEGRGGQRQAFLADGEALQGQQIFVADRGAYLEFQCKLSASFCTRAQKKFQALPASVSRLTYPDAATGDPITVCRARELCLGEWRVKVADPSWTEYLGRAFNRSFVTGFSAGLGFRPMPATTGLISLERTKTDPPLSVDALYRELSELLRDFFDVPDAAPPSPDDEREHKTQAWAWSQNLDPETLDAAERERIGANVERQEVFPGYRTMVEPGRAERYLDQAPFVLLHYIWGAHNLERCRQQVCAVLKSGGLCSRLERYANGKAKPALLEPDMATGGADSVFVRLAEKNPRKKSVKDGSQAYCFVIDPMIMDRLDWYGYHEDRFGSRDPALLEARDGADAFVERRLHGRNRSFNELMFPHGIPSEMLLGLTCKSDADREAMIEALQRAGIDQVNGRSLEEFVVVVGDDLWERVDLGMQRRHTPQNMNMSYADRN